MARTMNPTFVPTTTKAGSILIPLEEIPEEIKAEVEAMYAGLKANPNGRMRIAFEKAEEVGEYVLQVTSYCEQRPEGAIRFRRSPTRNLPDTMVDFRISDLPKEEPTAGLVAPTVPVQPTPIPVPAVPAKATTRRR